MWDTYEYKINISLIRHSTTYANENKLYYGFSDIPLSSKGIEILHNIKRDMVYIPYQLFITSGLKRANQTMEILFTDNYLINEKFKEINFGDFELKSYEDLKNDKSYLHWIEDTQNNEIPNGELKKDFDKRIFLGFEEVYKYALKNEIKNVVIVCHSGVIATIMQKLLPLENKTFYDWAPSYGRGYAIFFNYKKVFYKEI